MKLTDILNIINCVGTVATGVVGVITGAKLSEQGYTAEDFKNLDTYKKTLPTTAPLMICTAVTVGTGIATHKLDKKAVLAAVAGGVTTAELLKRYKDEMVRLFGKDKVDEISKKVINDAMNGVKSIPEKIKTKDQDECPFDIPTEKIKSTQLNKKYSCILEWGGVEFEATETTLLKSELLINKILNEEGQVSIVDYYDAINKFEKDNVITDENYEASDNCTGWDYDLLTDVSYTCWIDIKYLIDDENNKIFITFDTNPTYLQSLESAFAPYTFNYVEEGSK